jgi:5-methylcytosine-specific restriction endonuclease McrA
MSSKRKRCTKCLRNLPVTEFYRHPTTADRLHPFCKADCCRAGRRRYHEHPDVRTRVRESARRWRKQFPLKIKAQQAALSANLRAAGRGRRGLITGRDVISAWESSGYRCAVCDKDLSVRNGDLTLDHKVPLEFRWSNTPDNLRATCRSCNSKEYWRCRREHGEKRAAEGPPSELSNPEKPILRGSTANGTRLRTTIVSVNAASCMLSTDSGQVGYPFESA